MAYPELRGAGSKCVGTTGEVEVTAPTGIAVGDLEILIATTIAGGTVTITSNGGGAWTALAETPKDVTSGEKLYVWARKRAEGDGNPKVKAGSDHVCAARFGYKTGTYDSADFFEGEKSGAETTSDTSFNFAPGNETEGTERLCVVICTSGEDSNTGQAGNNTENSSLSSVELIVEYQTKEGGGGGFWLATGRLAAKGSFGEWTQTMVNATPKAYVSFAIRPKAVEPEPVTLALGAAAGQSGASLILSTPKPIPLAAAAGESSAALKAHAPTQIFSGSGGGPAPLAWSVDQKDLGHEGPAGAASSIELAITHPVAAGAWIFVALSNYNGAVNPSKVEGGGLAWTAIGDTVRSGNLVIAAYRAYAPAGLAEGTKLTGTFSGSTSSRKIAACSFKGAASGAVGKAKEEAETGKPHSTEPEAAAAGELILEVATANASTSNTPDANSIECLDFTGAEGETLCVEYRIAPGSGKVKVGGEWGSSARHVSSGIALSIGEGVRRFNGSSDYIKTALGNAGVTGAVTIAVIERAVGTLYHQTRTAMQVASGYGLNWNAERKPALYNSSVNVATAGLTSEEADGWTLWVVTKAAGTTTPRFYKRRLAEGSGSFADASGTQENVPGSPSAVYLGRRATAVQYFNGDLAAVGIWGKALSDAEVEALGNVVALDEWLATSPTALWLFDEAAVGIEADDETGGGANQTERSGTEVRGEAPPIPYEAGAAGPGPLVAAGQSTASLALEAEKAGVKLALGAAAGQSGASLVLKTGAKVVPAVAPGQSAASLNLHATTRIPLAASAGQSSASLALKTGAKIIPGAAAGESTAKCEVTVPGKAPVTLTLQSAAGQSGASAKLHAPTRIACGVAAGLSTASLTLRTGAKIIPAKADGLSGASLKLHAPTRVALNPAAGASSASLTLRTGARVIPAPAAGQSSATLALKARTRIVLGKAAGQSGASLILTTGAKTPAILNLGAAAGQSAASLTLQVAVKLPLGKAAGLSGAALTIRVSPRLVLAPATGTSSASLKLRAPTRLVLAPASGTSGASLKVRVAPRLVLAPAVGTSTARLALAFGGMLELQPAAGVSTASLVLVARYKAPPALPPMIGRGQEGVIAEQYAGDMTPSPRDQTGRIR